VGEIKGLALFRDRFAAHRDKYILIGGCALHAVLSNAGLKPRATKDLDVVLVVEAVDPSFVSLFWEFIEEGGYRGTHVSPSEKRNFYRFQKPTKPGFPAMIELFSRKPSLTGPLAIGTHLTPIPAGDDVESLSAILLDDEYYTFILAERRDLMGMPYIGEACLIALKAVAWLEMHERKQAGAMVDTSSIRKHLLDVLALSQALLPEVRYSVSPRIASDIARFVAKARTEHVDVSRFGRDASIKRMLQRVLTAFQGPT
jgi:hypothetical protein